MAYGTIQTLTDRGVGFIRPSIGGSDVFFHWSVLLDVAFEALEVGDPVVYTVGSDRHRQGVRSTAVRRAAGSPEHAAACDGPPTPA